MRHERIIERQDSGCGRVAILSTLNTSHPLIVIPPVTVHSAPHTFFHIFFRLNHSYRGAHSIQRTRHGSSIAQKREGRTPQPAAKGHDQSVMRRKKGG